MQYRILGGRISHESYSWCIDILVIEANTMGIIGAISHRSEMIAPESAANLHGGLVWS